MDYTIIIFLFFGILPSSIWLIFYLRKDLHPEPKRMIVKIFLLGAFITLPVFFVQVGLTNLFGLAILDSLFKKILYWFIVIAFSEELFKYLVVRLKVISSPHLDEPLDVMLYMVVSALGFAAIENILYLYAPIGQMSFNQLLDRTLIIVVIRFLGSTFLHTLCSATIGRFLANAIHLPKMKYYYIFSGLFIATLLHGLFDFSIIEFSGSIRIITPVAIIIVLAIFALTSMSKLKKMKGVCRAK